MATWSLRRFSCPEVLKSINPDHLVAFLMPHRRFFTSRGVSLPAPNANDEIDYQALVKVFLSPDAKTPKELIDALYFVDELATPEGMDALLAEADRLDLALDDGNDHTPADVAVQVWLLNKDILERKHAQVGDLVLALVFLLLVDHRAGQINTESRRQCSQDQ